jgi:hypothetical protein
MKQDVWIFLFLFGLLLFGWPILTIFRNDTAIYLFVAWAVFIGLIYLASVRADRGDGGN